MKRLVIPIVVAVLATSGGVFALTRETEQTPLVQQNIEQAEVEQEEVGLSAPETPVVTPAEEVETEPVEEEPVDPRADWEKYLDEKMATDEDAPYIIKCIHNGEGAASIIWNSNVWRASSEETKNRDVSRAYNKIKTQFLTQGYQPKKFSEVYCSK